MLPPAVIKSTHLAIFLVQHQSTAASTWWCSPRPRLDWVEMTVGIPEGPGCPGSSLVQTIFLLCYLLNDRRRASHSPISFFSCLSFARLLILSLLLMSNVHPNPGLVFLCSVCTGNVTWKGRSVQCCTCSKWVHLRCSLPFFSRFKTLGSSHSWRCFPCCVPACSGGPTPTKIVPSSSDSSSL